MKGNPNNKKRHMQYTGPTINTIKHGEKGRLITASRNNHPHFTSGIALWIAKDTGGAFGATDAAQWVTIQKE